MKLAAWRKREGKTQLWLSEQLDCSQAYISMIERTRSPLVPKPALMERIFAVTGGEVEPNDFYDLPRWRRLLDVALAAFAGRAA